MKKYIFVLFILSFFSFSLIENCNAKPKLVFGTRSHPIGNGEGCEGDHGLCIIIHGRVVNDDFDVKDLGDDMGLVEAEIIDGELKLNILFDESKYCFEKDFTVIKNIVLDEEVSEKLGYQNVTIEAGVYRVDFSKFRYGSVVLPVQIR